MTEVMCNCLDTVNERLKSKNTRLVRGQPEMEGRALIETWMINHAGGPRYLVYASFCPFCGQPYGEDRGGVWSGSKE
jgi:hypothetical protein